jgi:hypothetical protein
MNLNPINHYNPIIAPLIKILDPPLGQAEPVLLLVMVTIASMVVCAVNFIPLISILIVMAG